MTDATTKRAYTAIMDVPPTLAAAKLVQVHKAGNEMEGNLLVAHLQDNGIEVAMRLPPSVPPYDAVEWMVGKNKIYSIFVREPDADHARQLIQQFSATAVDMPSLEALAAQRLPLTRDVPVPRRIGRGFHRGSTDLALDAVLLALEFDRSNSGRSGGGVVLDTARAVRRSDLVAEIIDRFPQAGFQIHLRFPT